MSEARLTNSDIAELTAWRRHLHRHPELSGHEEWTAAEVVRALQPLAPTEIVTRLGGHGVGAVFGGSGPSVLIRCELDALPIAETGTPPHRSTVPGHGHLCGHDGHMAVLMGVARWLSRHPPNGRVILLFQPAEEDGSGAKRVLEDPRFAALTPDYAFALHNYPGLPVGRALVAPGVMNCASRGMKIKLRGRTSHASEPEQAVSPTDAVAALLTGLTALSSGQYPNDTSFALATVTHASIGTPAFGIAPGDAEIWVTLRTRTDDLMAALVSQAEALVRDNATQLAPEITYEDIFRHCENDPDATAILTSALDAESITWLTEGLPMRASEDFGRFGDITKSAMFLLGAGADHPRLHQPDYDFPDDLIPIGASVFIRAIQSALKPKTRPRAG